MNYFQRPSSISFWGFLLEFLLVIPPEVPCGDFSRMFWWGFVQDSMFWILSGFPAGELCPKNCSRDYSRSSFLRIPPRVSFMVYFWLLQEFLLSISPDLCP